MDAERSSCLKLMAESNSFRFSAREKEEAEKKEEKTAVVKICFMLRF